MRLLRRSATPLWPAGQWVEEKMPKTLKDTFSAWINKQPGAGSPLHVAGEVEVPTGGWSGSLVRAVPQGINPLILILDLKLTKPTGIVTQAFTHIRVEFTETPAAVEYESAQIRADDGEFEIPVKIVH
jgi:hypothetical protein